MWLDKIESFQKDNSQILDMKHELHLAIYIKGLLKESSKFKNYNIKKGYKNLNSIKKIKKDSLNLSI